MEGVRQKNGGVVTKKRVILRSSCSQKRWNDQLIGAGNSRHLSATRQHGGTRKKNIALPRRKRQNGREACANTLQASGALNSNRAPPLYVAATRRSVVLT